MKKLLTAITYFFTGNKKHVFTLGKSELWDGENRIGMMFGPCGMVEHLTGKSVCEEDESYVRVATKPSPDDDFVMVYNNCDTTSTIYYKVGDSTYGFCEDKFKQYFPLTTKKLFVKLLS